MEAADRGFEESLGLIDHEETLILPSKPTTQLPLFNLISLALGVLLGFVLGETALHPRGVSISQHGSGGDNAVANFEAPYPELSELVDRGDIVGDVSWILDFSIADFPKAGTTFLMNYLRRKNALGNEEIYINNGELCFLDRRRPSKLVETYYYKRRQQNRTTDGYDVKFGLKCPQELETEFGLQRYRRYFSKTNIIVSVRHPILWFESYYNFRAYKRFPVLMPDPNDLIGSSEPNYPYSQWNCSKSCPSGNQNVYTDRANFHWALSRMGKTPMLGADEMELLPHNMSIVPIKAKVFLVENRQLLMESPASVNFTSDLRDFLGLHQELPALQPWEQVPPEVKYSNKTRAAQRIDICESRYDEARSILLENSKNAAKWITEYFIESDDVVVPSKELFVGLLKDWAVDPCDEQHWRRLRVDSPE